MSQPVKPAEPPAPEPPAPEITTPTWRGSKSAASDAEPTSLKLWKHQYNDPKKHLARAAHYVAVVQAIKATFRSTVLRSNSRSSQLKNTTTATDVGLARLGSEDYTVDGTLIQLHDYDFRLYFGEQGIYKHKTFPVRIYGGFSDRNDRKTPSTRVASSDIDVTLSVPEDATYDEMMIFAAALSTVLSQQTVATGLEYDLNFYLGGSIRGLPIDVFIASKLDAFLKDYQNLRNLHMADTVLATKLDQQEESVLQLVSRALQVKAAIQSGNLTTAKEIAYRFDETSGYQQGSRKDPWIPLPIDESVLEALEEFYSTLAGYETGLTKERAVKVEAKISEMAIGLMAVALRLAQDDAFNGPITPRVLDQFRNMMAFHLAASLLKVEGYTFALTTSSVVFPSKLASPLGTFDRKLILLTVVEQAYDAYTKAMAGGLQKAGAVTSFKPKTLMRAADNLSKLKDDDYVDSDLMRQIAAIIEQMRTKLSAFDQEGNSQSKTAEKLRFLLERVSNRASTAIAEDLRAKGQCVTRDCQDLRGIVLRYQAYEDETIARESTSVGRLQNALVALRMAALAEAVLEHIQLPAPDPAFAAIARLLEDQQKQLVSEAQAATALQELDKLEAVDAAASADTALGASVHALFRRRPKRTPDIVRFLDHRYMDQYRLHAPAAGDLAAFQSTPMWSTPLLQFDQLQSRLPMFKNFHSAAMLFYLPTAEAGPRLQGKMLGQLVVTRTVGQSPRVLDDPVELLDKFNKGIETLPVENPMTTIFNIVDLRVTVTYNPWVKYMDKDGKPRKRDGGENLTASQIYLLHVVPLDTLVHPAESPSLQRVGFRGLTFPPAMGKAEVSLELKKKLISDGAVLGDPRKPMTVDTAQHALWLYGTDVFPDKKGGRFYRYVNVALPYVGQTTELDRHDDRAFTDSRVFDSDAKSVVEITTQPKLVFDDTAQYLRDRLELDK